MGVTSATDTSNNPFVFVYAHQLSSPLISVAKVRAPFYLVTSPPPPPPIRRPHALSAMVTGHRIPSTVETGPSQLLIKWTNKR